MQVNCISCGFPGFTPNGNINANALIETRSFESVGLPFTKIFVSYLISLGAGKIEPGLQDDVLHAVVKAGPISEVKELFIYIYLLTIKSSARSIINITHKPKRTFDTRL